MYGFEVDYSFEDVLKGEFAGKIYVLEKFLPVIDSMRGDASLNNFFAHLENSQNLLIYFDSQSRAIFAINYAESGGRLKIELVKPAVQDFAEIHRFSYRLAQVFPNCLLTIVDEYHLYDELESA